MGSGSRHGGGGKWGPCDGLSSTGKVPLSLRVSGVSPWCQSTSCCHGRQQRSHLHYKCRRAEAMGSFEQCSIRAPTRSHCHPSGTMHAVKLIATMPQMCLTQSSRSMKTFFARTLPLSALVDLQKDIQYCVYACVCVCVRACVCVRVRACVFACLSVSQTRCVCWCSTLLYTSVQACGSAHCLAIDSNGTLFSWATRKDGARMGVLGRPSTPAHVGGEEATGRGAQNGAQSPRDDVPAPVQLPDRAAQCACGDAHRC